ncbi:MAG: sensor histidine kinase [Nitrospiraceae bacterium]|nr:sensor histidine kinase [Nitrospiraceae bacterium]
MNPEPVHESRKVPVLPIALAIAAAVLAIDVYTPQEMPPQYLYVLCILLTVWSPREQTLWWMATLCTILTALGSYLSPPTFDFYIILFNRSIAVVLFLATALLVQNYRRTHDQLHQLNQELEARVEDRTRDLSRVFEEREQLNRDLHDDVLQSLYAVGLRLEAGRAGQQADPTEAVGRIPQALDQLKLTMQHIRSYIAGPQPAHEGQPPFDTALPALVQSMTIGTGPQLRVDMEPRLAAHLSHEQADSILLIVREALSNCLQHSRAHEGVVTAQRQNGTLRIEIRDDGIGFDPAAMQQASHGLANIGARAKAIGADLQIVSQPGQGVRIALALPLPQRSSGS